MANGTSGDDNLSNTDLENYGLDGNDIIVSKLLSGHGYMEGGNGNDILTLANGGTASIEAWGNSGDDWLSGDDGADSLFGGVGNDLLEGGTGKDTLNGGSDTDGLYGSDGDDSLYGVDGNDTRVLVTINLQSGPISFYGGLYGGIGNDTLDGGAGDDWLDGGVGNDKLYGGTGNDTFLVDSFHDQAFEQPGEGYDTVIVEAFEFYLQAGQEIEVLQAAAGDASRNLFGNEFGQTLFGNDGANTLDGGGGTDTFFGGKGNDRYIVDSADDRVYEHVGEGYDGIASSATYALAAGQEIESLSALPGAGSLDLTGNEFGQGLYGNEGVNVLKGGGGNDSLYGGAGDKLYGGTGHDFYLIQAGGAPAIFESVGEGSDQVVVAVDAYTLSAGAEIELIRTSLGFGEPLHGFRLTGNAFAQTIEGNAANDMLNDGGGAAADTLSGLGGDDVYVIHNAGAIIQETAGQGSDTVLSSVSYALKAGVSVEALGTTNAAGTGDIDLTGNAFAQKITGNAGNNVLNDGSSLAADTLSGLGGNDIYVIHNAGAVIVEAGGQGTDAVLTSVDYVLKNGVSVETLGTTNSAGTGAIDLTGNSIGQTVRGNAGSNVIDGKGGADTLTGFGGKDFFVFSSAIGASSDTVTDFNVADDTIRLENAIFTKLTNTGTLSSTLFRSNSTGTAVDGNDYVLYDNTDGKLYYDADGSGAGTKIHFATLTGAPAITNADFVVV